MSCACAIVVRRHLLFLFFLITPLLWQFLELLFLLSLGAPRALASGHDDSGVLSA